MGRIAAEGRVDSFVDANGGAMIEVNCETDFVAKNDEFKSLVAGLAENVEVLKPADVEALLASKCVKCDKVIEDALKEKIASIGEKLLLEDLLDMKVLLQLTFTMENRCIIKYR